MRILSIDIGIRNFAYCVVDIESPQNPLALLGPQVQIIQWEKIDMLEENQSRAKSAKSIVMSRLYPLVCNTLSRRLYQWKIQQIDKVLVETQIGKSKNAKLEGMIGMWLHVHFGKFHGVSPHWKLQLGYRDNQFYMYTEQHVASSYEHRKQYTVKLIEKWIQIQPQNVQEFFGRFKGRIKSESKQDDLADCLCQAIAWYLKNNN